MSLSQRVKISEGESQCVFVATSVWPKWQKILTVVAKLLVNFGGFSEAIKRKKWSGNFYGKFCKNWATFFSKIWSHFK